MNGLEYQQLTLEKIIKQPILKKTMLDMVINSKQYETTFEIVDNMTRGWQGVKGCHNIDDMRAKNVVTSMFVSNSTQSSSTLGWLIRMNPRILNKGQTRGCNLRMGLA
jgi:hypothetical protein